MAPLTQQRLVFMGIAICVTLLLILTARSLMRSVGRRETAENQLREAQSRYQGLVESLPVGVVVHRNGKFLYVNPAAVAILGARSADALLGQPILEIVHPDFREAAVARIKFSLETGQAMPPYEEKFLKIDGTVIDVEVRGNAITFEGEPASQVSFQDITERKKVEQALHASEEKWRSIIANSVNGIGRERALLPLPPAWGSGPSGCFSAPCARTRSRVAGLPAPSVASTSSDWGVLVPSALTRQDTIWNSRLMVSGDRPRSSSIFWSPPMT